MVTQAQELQQVLAQHFSLHRCTAVGPCWAWLGWAWLGLAGLG